MSKQVKKSAIRKLRKYQVIEAPEGDESVMMKLQWKNWRPLPNSVAPARKKVGMLASW